MLAYLPLYIICSSKLTVSCSLRSRKTVRFSEQILYADNYSGIFSHQMGAIAYLTVQCSCADLAHYVSSMRVQTHEILPYASL